VITYAQNYEDVMLARAFGHRNQGFYVDVGAGDPNYLSVTRWFYDQGWSGINLEPNRRFFEELVKNRPRDVTFNIGASDVRGVLTFAEAEVGELSTFDLAGAGDDAVRREVAVAPLDDILAEHAGGRSIDFLKIDVEGWELHVLKGLDLARFRPAILVIEAVLREGRTMSHQAWEPLVLARGYTMAHFDGLNRFYVAEEKRELADIFRLPPGVFDEITPSQVVTLAHELRQLTDAVRDLAASVVPTIALGATAPVADVLHALSEIRQRNFTAHHQQARLLLACDELIATVAARNLAAAAIPPAPDIDRALAGIRLANEALAAGSPDPENPVPPPDD
jgi:FkbM family methyltransferase